MSLPILPKKEEEESYKIEDLVRVKIAWELECGADEAAARMIVEHEVKERASSPEDTDSLIQEALKIAEACIVKQEPNEYLFVDPAKDEQNKRCLEQIALQTCTVRLERIHNIHRPFLCKICWVTFSSKKTRRKHMRSHPPKVKNNPKYYCDYCSKAFSVKIYLIKHIQGHMRIKSYTCEICKKQFYNFHYYEKHVVQHARIKRYSCDVCHKKFMRKESMKLHKVLHTGERNYMCSVCGKVFTSSTVLQRHTWVHDKSKLPFSCPVCGKQFKNNWGLKNHLRGHEESSYKCIVCGLEFKELSVLILHAEVHAECYYCDCGKRFSEKQSLITHVQNRHMNKKKKWSIQKPGRFQCKHCPKYYTRKVNLKKHEVTHFDGPTYSCRFCEKTYNLKESFIRHERFHWKKHDCLLCGKTFQTTTGLRNHILVHTGEKPFSCDICKKCFKEKAHLNRHLRIHNNDKPFECDVCPKKFSDPSNLVHHKKMHANDRPHSCDLCDMSFMNLSKLAIHKRVHTGNIYSCEFCDNVYTNLVSFKRHLKIHYTAEDVPSGSGQYEIEIFTQTEGSIY